MPIVGALPIILGAVGAGTSVASGLIGANAAKDAASTQSDAAKAAGFLGQSAAAAASSNLENRAQSNALDLISSAEQNATGVGKAGWNALNWSQGATDEANARLDPYSSLGAGAASQLSNLLSQGPQKFVAPTNGYTDITNNALNQAAGAAPGAEKFSFTPSDLQNDPGYQFTRDQAIKALDRSAAARGVSLSGDQLKAVESYGAGLGQQTFQNAFNRAQSTFTTNRDTALSRVQSLLGVANASSGIGNAAFGQSLAGFGANQGAYQNQLQNLLAFSGQGQNAALAQGANSIGQGQYMGNTLLNTTKYEADLNYNAAQQAAAQRLQAQLQSGDWTLQGAGMAANGLQGAANAQAAGTVGAANAWTGSLTGLSNSVTNAALLGQILKQQTGSPYTAAGGANPNPAINLGEVPPYTPPFLPNG